MNIACIGNVTYDFTVIGKGFIKENGKFSYSEKTIKTGGPACNAAFVINKLGNPVDFYGQIGNDEFGDYVYNDLYNDGLGIEHLNISDNVMTPFSFIIINTDKATRTINSVRSPKDLEMPRIENFTYKTNYDYILTDGKYVSESSVLIDANPNAVSIIDAGRVNDGVIKLCEKVDYIICSQEFAEGITGLFLNQRYNNDSFIYQKLKERFPNAKGITITVGKYGFICEKDNVVYNVPTFDPKAPSIDTNAAGDIFHGAFTYALANNYDYYDALEFANVTASLSTTRIGGKDSCPSLEDIKNGLDNDDFSLGRRK